MTEVIGLGAGGHARVVIDILRVMNNFKIAGLLDRDRNLWGTSVLGVEVLGDDSLMIELLSGGIRSAFIGLGSIEQTGPRIKLYENARSKGFEIVSAIHPSAVVSRSASIGNGPTIMAGAIVNAAARLGNNVIVNSGAIVEHDCVVGDHSHIATGARMAGTVSVGSRCHIGLGASIREGLTIGDGSIVGAGAVVVDDVPGNTVVVGVPAKVHRVID